jgi:hypothetical protein
VGRGVCERRDEGKGRVNLEDKMGGHSMRQEQIRQRK